MTPTPAALHAAAERLGVPVTWEGFRPPRTTLQTLPRHPLEIAHDLLSVFGCCDADVTFGAVEHDTAPFRTFEWTWRYGILGDEHGTGDFITCVLALATRLSPPA